MITVACVDSLSASLLTNFDCCFHVAHRASSGIACAFDGAFPLSDSDRLLIATLS